MNQVSRKNILLKSIIYSIFTSPLAFNPQVFATESTDYTQVLAEWIAEKSSLEVITQCNNVISGQDTFATYSATELQIILAGKTCEQLIAELLAE